METEETECLLKRGEFFRDQGGLMQPWGKHWTGIKAKSIGDARRKAAKIVGVTLSHIYEGEE